ncbi:hypothetical protein CIG75_11850 [Tumebacillus algifaecis]|uniref:GP-PDE domain-containing protein n=1 Tax=Tumebacillus algifaecis TaxID=1214604 RepID=A0A223D1Y6_9BACL|nr:glycerophosphodiester phosphodiesterase family protein [Tumebacillus algifaecis]ASS75612.1 hypothetical protein CIG75_11850 [Tumebacillus algifaecis]
MNRFYQLVFTLLLSTSLVTASASGASARSLSLPENSYSSVLKPSPILTIAHRGAAAHAPENTIAAFDKAVALHADFIELDIQLCKDGELVVLHDDTVNRTTDGQGNVKNFTLAQLRKLDAGSKFHPSFKGATIPTLDEVLTRYKGSIGILIEMKTPSRYPSMEQKVASLLQKHKMDQADSGVIVQSFDSRSLQTFHQLAPLVPIGVLIDRADLLNEPQLIRYSSFATYINPNKKLINSHLVNRLHEFGLKVATWTVRSAKDIPALIKAGVDGLITDDPSFLR